jgi:ribosomal protein S18 acetylase RimI-like enzyme
MADKTSIENITIRNCKEDDFGTIIPLLNQLWPQRDFNLEAMKTVFFKGLKSKYQYYLLACLNDISVGFCSISIRMSLYAEGNLAHIDELVVDEKFRSLGIGKLFLDKAKSIAFERRCSKLELESALHRDEAHRFYEKHNFEKAGYVLSTDV